MIPTIIIRWENHNKSIRESRNIKFGEITCRLVKEHTGTSEGWKTTKSSGDRWQKDSLQHSTISSTDTDLYVEWMVTEQPPLVEAADNFEPCCYRGLRARGAKWQWFYTINQHFHIAVITSWLFNLLSVVYLTEPTRLHWPLFVVQVLVTWFITDKIKSQSLTSV